MSTHKNEQDPISIIRERVEHLSKHGVGHSVTLPIVDDQPQSDSGEEVGNIVDYLMKPANVEFAAPEGTAITIGSGQESVVVSLLVGT